MAEISEQQKHIVSVMILFFSDMKEHFKKEYKNKLQNTTLLNFPSFILIKRTFISAGF